MLNFYSQADSSDQKRQLLKPSTVKSLLWSPQVKIPIENKRGEKNYFDAHIDSIVSYGMGWFVVQRKNDSSLKYAYHTGGACGATSCLLIKPDDSSNAKNSNGGGVVVAVLCNSQDVSDISKFTNHLASLYSDNED